jgi:LysM repeat protein
MGNSFIFDDEETEQPEGMDGENGAGGEEPGGDEGGNNRTFLLAVGVLGAIVLVALLCLAVYAGFILPRQRQAAAAQQAAQLVQNTQIAQAATETAIAAAGGSSYTVQLGDTLAAIAARFGIALDALRNANPGLGDTPTPGTIIILPIQGGGSSYTVQAGDTLLAIAARFSISVDDLRNANPGLGDSLTPGQIIIIPGPLGLLPSPPPQASVTPTPVVVFPTSTPIVVATVNPITATVAAAYTQAALAQLTVIPTSTALGAVPSTGFADEVGLPALFILGAVFLVVIFVVRRVRTAQ